MAYVLSYLFAFVTFIWVFVTTLQLASTVSLLNYASLPGPHYEAVQERTVRHVRGESKLNASTVEYAHFGDWGRVLWQYFWNIVLLILFIVQHSFMASSSWKETLEDIGLQIQTRSIYVFMSAFCLQVLMNYWIIIPVVPLWWIDLSERPILWLFFALLHSFMWILIFGAALTMDLPELTGVKQVYYADQGYDPPMSYKSREVRGLYRHMRHAGVWCFLVILWVHPVMTLDRWALAVTWTIYLLWSFRVTDRDYEYVEKQYELKHSSHSMVYKQYVKHQD